MIDEEFTIQAVIKQAEDYREDFNEQMLALSSNPYYVENND